MDHTIKIRASSEDKAAFSKAADDEGLSLSAWARRHLKVQAEFDRAAWFKSLEKYGTLDPLHPLYKAHQT